MDKGISRSRRSPSLFDAMNSVITGMIMKMIVNLGKTFFPRSSGRVSVAIPPKKGNRTESRKYFACRFRGVSGSMRLHQQMRTTMLAIENAE